MPQTERFTERELDRIIEMAWEDRTPFEAIVFQFDLAEKDVIKLMRSNLKESSFKRWRKRVNSEVRKKHLNKKKIIQHNNKKHVTTSKTHIHISKTHINISQTHINILRGGGWDDSVRRQSIPWGVNLKCRVAKSVSLFHSSPQQGPGPITPTWTAAMLLAAEWRRGAAPRSYTRRMMMTQLHLTIRISCVWLRFFDRTPGGPSCVKDIFVLDFWVLDPRPVP